MLTAQSTNVTVPSAEDTVANISDNSPYPRMLYILNQHTTAIQVKVQLSTDGGASWSNLSPTPSTISPNSVLSMQITSVGSFLRIRASGGPGKAYVGIARFFVPSTGQTVGLNLQFFS